jgi:hypothetical protein
MNHASRWMLMLAALTGISGCVTYPDYYVAAGPGGTWIDCRYQPCTRDGYTYWSGNRARGDGWSSWHGSTPAWYGSSRWYAPYRVGYTPWGFRDPWYDPWYGGWTWASPWYPAWHPTSRWSWSVGYGWSSSPWSGSVWYQPWSHPSWYGPGWHGSGWHGGGWWHSTWHRPYRGHRPPPRDRHVDWRPADGIGVSSLRWLPASEEVQRIANRNALGGDGLVLDGRPASVYEPRRTEPASAHDVREDPTRLDRSAGRVMPRGAADGWIAPMPDSRPPTGERRIEAGVADVRSGAVRPDPLSQRFDAPEAARHERPMPERFERSEPARFDPPPQRFEAPQPARYERPMPERFERSEPARFDLPPQRFEAPQPARYEPPAATESRSSGRRSGREDFEPN